MSQTLTVYKDRVKEFDEVITRMADNKKIVEYVTKKKKDLLDLFAEYEDKLKLPDSNIDKALSLSYILEEIKNLFKMIAQYAPQEKPVNIGVESYYSSPTDYITPKEEQILNAMVSQTLKNDILELNDQKSFNLLSIINHIQLIRTYFGKRFVSMGFWTKEEFRRLRKNKPSSITGTALKTYDDILKNSLKSLEGEKIISYASMYKVISLVQWYFDNKDIPIFNENIHIDHWLKKSITNFSECSHVNVVIIWDQSTDFYHYGPKPVSKESKNNPVDQFLKFFKHKKDDFESKYTILFEPDKKVDFDSRGILRGSAMMLNVKNTEKINISNRKYTVSIPSVVFTTGLGPTSIYAKAGVNRYQLIKSILVNTILNIIDLYKPDKRTKLLIILPYYNGSSDLHHQMVWKIGVASIIYIVGLLTNNNVNISVCI